MIHHEVLIVGGGPGGSACAWRLKQNGIDCAVIDQQAFPRLKPCAGWITPEVLSDLQLEPAQYPCGLITFDALHISIRGLYFKVPTRQHAIRRIEFDHFLLLRSGAPLYQHSVKSITQSGNGYLIDDEYSSSYLVGAGGTYCPVYRGIFRPSAPKERKLLVAAQEEEFPYPYTDGQCRLWFLENGLPGYSWYVPKANGYVNVGVGGMADQLNARNETVKNHWNFLVEKLDRLGLVRGHEYHPVAHSYYLRSRQSEFRKGNAFLVGDSAGLATRDLGEGIGAAIRSGLKAADTILNRTAYSVQKVARYSAWSILRNRR